MDINIHREKDNIIIDVKIDNDNRKFARFEVSLEDLETGITIGQLFDGKILSSISPKMDLYELVN